jgi:hypothetical protein
MVLATPERFTALVTPPDDRTMPALWFAFQGAQILIMRDAQSAVFPARWTLVTSAYCPNAANTSASLANSIVSPVS